MPQQYQRVLKSTNIEGLAYDSKGGVGYVEFIGGRRYAYSMPLGVFHQMQNSPSVGKFFAAQVKGKFQQVWQGQRCNNSPCSNDAEFQADIAGTTIRVCAYCREHEPRFRGVPFGGIQPDAPKGKSKK